MDSTWLSSARKSSSCSISDGVICAFTGTQRFSRIMNKKPQTGWGESLQGDSGGGALQTGGSCDAPVRAIGLELPSGEHFVLRLPRMRDAPDAPCGNRRLGSALTVNQPQRFASGFLRLVVVYELQVGHVPI